MTAPASHFDSAAEEQASLWAARLDGGTLSSADRDALDAWLNAQPAHRTLLSRYCQFSVDLEEPLLALVANGAVTPPPESVVEEVSAPRSRRTRRPAWLAASALAAAAAVAVVVWISRPAPQQADATTAAAQRTALTLPDGTRVELNAHTRLTASLGAGERRVRLSGGEAFFTVSKDPGRPFVVETPGGAVRVTGTVFDVRSETPAELVVTVVEGSVQVRPGTSAGGAADETLGLTAREQVAAGPGGVARGRLSAEELDDALAWRRGQVVFRNASLNEALQRFARFHGRKIIVSAAVLAPGPAVGGRYSIDDLEGFLTGLAASHDVRVWHEPAGTIRVSLQRER